MIIYKLTLRKWNLYMRNIDVVTGIHNEEYLKKIIKNTQILIQILILL